MTPTLPRRCDHAGPRRARRAARGFWQSRGGVPGDTRPARACAVGRQELLAPVEGATGGARRAMGSCTRGFVNPRVQWPTIIQGFPVYAGMTRDRSSPPGDLSRLPRTRGDDAHLLPLHPAPAVLRVALQQHAHGILDPASIERDYWMFQVARMMQAGSSACIPVSPFVIRRMPASAARARSDAVIAARPAASHLKRTWRSALRRPHYAARGTRLASSRNVRTLAATWSLPTRKSAGKTGPDPLEAGG